MVEHQVLEERYVDKTRLLQLLRRLFGVGNFEVEVSQTALEDKSAHALML